MELLVVIVILGLLASLTMWNLGDKVEVAKEAKAKADIKIIETAVELYKMDEGKYPDSLDKLKSKYLKSIPNDPWDNDYKLGKDGTVEASKTENSEDPKKDKE
ncbi:type II secretion system protein G (GspG) [Desulfonispora thiosulfatigenes DSM 11270]|uniref:Type II secretion system protein G (GspG) n=2 Tax=Desulfonispora thiosulfatigenes TaxID=83661 RepID=A0A1W1VP65_DESTI|nr:type II secretion system protein G (GspG) [Desulfonispora thiosulfatigenes DSM 11270]